MFKSWKDYSCKYPKHDCELYLDQKLRDRTRWEEFKKNFKKIFMISQKNFAMPWFLRSIGHVELEIELQEKSKTWFIVHPFSILRLVWLSFMILVFIFCMFFLPFRLSFLNSFMAGYAIYMNRSTEDILTGANIQLGLTSVWNVDMLAGFFAGYYNLHTGKVVMDWDEIIKHYAFPDFILYALTSVPVDYVIIKFYGMNAYGSIGTAGFYLLQFYNIFTLIRFKPFFFGWYNMGKINHGKRHLFRISSALLIFLLIYVWCTWLDMIVPQLVRRELMYKGNETWSWIEESRLLEHDLKNRVACALINALHYSLGFSTEWNSLYTSVDFISALVIIFTCRLYWLYFMIVILQNVTASNALQIKIHLIKGQLIAYLKQENLPAVLKKQMDQYYMYRFQAHYFSNKSILKKLTSSLRKEISMYTCQKYLLGLEIFRSVPKKVLIKFIERMHKEMYFPGDFIFQGNTLGESMFFICSGTVVVETTSGKEICRLSDGDFFGEIALVADDGRRTATVCAITITEVYRLDSSDYALLVEHYPDVYVQLEKIAFERHKLVQAAESSVSLKGSQLK